MQEREEDKDFDYHKTIQTRVNFNFSFLIFKFINILNIFVNEDSKPPILRRYNVHQSDGFISNDLLPAYDSPLNNNHRREILSKKEVKQHNQELQDSLKIIKNSQIQNNNNNNNINDVRIKNLANQMEKNPFLSKKKIQSNYNNSPSSSSSSISSSSDDNDPGKELIRFEKRKIK